MDDFNFVEDDDLDINAMFDNQDEFPLDDEFIRTHFNTLDSETIQNFPFVEDDIDAITDYELFSKGFGYLEDKKADKEELSKVAFTGDYNDLINKPVIPDLSQFVTKDTTELENYTLTSDLSEVALSGNYNDLSHKPNIPTKTSDLSNDSGFIDKDVNNLTNYTKTSSLATVATSGSYNDLSNKPSIPTYDSGTFTPTILGLTTAGTATYTTQEGRYIKIGNLLHIEIKLVCKLENSNGYIGIRGFPTNLGTLHDAGVCNVNTDLTTSNYPLFARVFYTQNLLLQYGNGGAYSNQNWSSNKNIYISGTFILT